MSIAESLSFSQLPRANRSNSVSSKQELKYSRIRERAQLRLWTIKVIYYYLYALDQLSPLSFTGANNS